MTPPAKDSLGQPYACSSTVSSFFLPFYVASLDLKADHCSLYHLSQSCALHIHGYTERRDPKATFSSPSAVGLMMAVGNVGEELAAYTFVSSLFTFIRPHFRVD